MSFLFKKVAAQDEKAYGVPADLWNKIRGFQCSYIIAGELKKGKSIEEVETRLYNSAVGSQIPGRYNDFMKGVEVLREMKKRGLDSCGEDAAHELRIIHAKGVGKWWVEPNVSFFGGEWGKGRKEFNNREEAEKYAKGTGKTYYILDECEGKDSAEFKVGDKIWVDPYYGANLNIGYGWNVGIVKRVTMEVIYVDFKGQVISVPAPYCARVNSSGKPVFDSAAMDARSDVRMHLHEAENHIVGVVNSFTNYAVDKTAKEIAAIDELKGVIGIIHKVASVF